MGSSDSVILPRQESLCLFSAVLSPFGPSICPGFDHDWFRSFIKTCNSFLHTFLTRRPIRRPRMPTVLTTLAHATIAFPVYSAWNVSHGRIESQGRKKSLLYEESTGRSCSGTRLAHTVLLDASKEAIPIASVAGVFG